MDGEERLKEAEERVRDLADRVLVPEMLAPNAKLVLFGQTLQARPLTAKFAKRLNQVSRDLFRNVMGLIAAQRSGDADRLAEFVRDHPGLDDEAARVLIECVQIVSEFYRVPNVDSHVIEETYTIPECLRIVQFQVGLNEAADFLLQPLRITLDIVGSIPVIASGHRLTVFQNSSDLPASAAPGA